MRFPHTLAIAAILTLAATPAFAADFVIGSVATNANAFVTNALQGGDVSRHKIVTAAPSVGLSAIRSVSDASNTTRGVTSHVTSTSDATASWANANSGSFTSTTTRAMSLPAKFEEGIFAGANNFDHSNPENSAFDYTFKAGGTDNLLSINYTIGLTGDVGPTSPGMGSWQIVLQELLDGGGKSDIGFLQIDGATTDGQFSAALQSGHTYELRFLNDEGLVLPDTTFHNINSQDVATFNWDINANGTGGGVGDVPEPASWALMLGGFGMIGGTLRSSRRRAVIAL